MKGRRSILAACCAVSAAVMLVAPASASDTGTVTESLNSSDHRWHIDVNITFAGTGSGQYQANAGAGTVRVTLPGIEKTPQVAFGTPPADPASYGDCQITAGAFGVAKTGFECSSSGQVIGVSQISYPTDATIHIVSPSCYTFPAADAQEPARADIWAAADSTDRPPDATYVLSFDAQCPAPTPIQTQTKTEAPAGTCTVPKLRGKTLSAATSALTNAGCAGGTLKRIFSRTVK